MVAYSMKTAIKSSTLQWSRSQPKMRLNISKKAIMKKRQPLSYAVNASTGVLNLNREKGSTKIVSKPVVVTQIKPSVRYEKDATKKPKVANNK